MIAITWNSQGYKDGEYYQLMKKWNIDFMCVQECGILAATAQFGQVDDASVLNNHNIGTRTRRNEISLVHWTNPLAQNPRCSMAIIVSQNIQDTHQFVPDIYYCDQKKRSIRPMLFLYSKESKTAIASVHCPSGNNAFASSVRNAFASYMMGNYDWHILGDFNCPPDASGLPQGSDILSPDKATHESGGILDYLVQSSRIPFQVCGVVDWKTSDHRPVLFY